MIRKLIKPASVVLLGLVAGLAISETALWRLGVPRFLRAHTAPEQPQFRLVGFTGDTLFYVNAPSTVLRFVYDGNPRGYFDASNAVDHTTNSLGFRGGEFTAAKDSATTRIAFLGDSFTFGEGVKDGDVYPQQVVRQLHRRFPGRRFEAYNFGVGGYNTTQALFLLRNLVLKFQPDIVVLGYVPNDAESVLFAANPATGEVKRRAREAQVFEGLSELAPPANPVFRLRSARLLWQVLSRRYASRQTVRHYVNLYRDDNPEWANTRRSLAAFGATCAAQRIDCFVTLFPLLFRLDETHPFMGITASVQQAIRASGPTAPAIIDLFPVMRGRSDFDLRVHPTDQHPNEIAHALAAAAIVDTLVGRHPEWR